MARFLVAAFTASGILHGVAYASLGLAPRGETTRLPASSVVFEVHEKAAPFETKPEPVKPPPEEPKVVERRAAVTPAAAKPAPEPEPARAPVNLSGVTLTNEDGSGGFAMPTGDGSERRGPLGPLGAKPVASVTTPVTTAAPAVAARPGAELVASRDLSEHPRPPALDGALRSLYPDEARRRAISGTASLRVRIGADGRVKEASVMAESFAGFGSACQKAVLGSHWSAPRDREGRAVQTEVRYTCRFVVD
jgi:periplasmic protein TonB